MSRKITLQINFNRPFSNRSLNPTKLKLKHSKINIQEKTRHESLRNVVKQSVSFQDMLATYETFYSNGSKPKTTLKKKRPQNKIMNSFFFKNKIKNHLRNGSYYKALSIEQVNPKSISKTIDLGNLQTYKYDPIVIQKPRKKESDTSSVQSFTMRSHYSSFRKQNFSVCNDKMKKSIQVNTNEISLENSFSEKKKKDIILLNPFFQAMQEDETQARILDFQEFMKAYTVSSHLKQTKVR